MCTSNKNWNFSNQSVVLYTTFVALLFSSNNLFSQEFPNIITNKEIAAQNYLPDFSYAGYHFGEEKIPQITEKIITVFLWRLFGLDSIHHLEKRC